ncbi:hypothetical protein IP90_03158 [Luteimonas cucumeris]|uniref:Endonuclease/exonuclease/phosphatase domain-containing protein n=1 Tax=Luteimonas cucumeris TaxID=985012 RepID=A0A562KUY7_9GAMM|nr:ExeM/NucH family extracellular endonuclease [Luteimonas cucumeris]TWH99167.1 hypothetical protein IP90_03158 [Luteimonas cucumeris]
MIRSSHVLCLLLVLLGGCRSAPSADHAHLADVDAVIVSAPPPDWQAYDGRRVRIEAPLTITGNRDLDRGRLLASFDGRLFAPTEIARPGAAAADVAADNARRQLTIELAPDVAAAAQPWRSGSLLEGVEGRIVARDDGFVLQADAPLHVRASPRPAAPQVAGDVRIASFNLHNLFNGDGRGGGFPTARGARTAQAYARQQDKLVATIRALDPDIAALMELENDGYDPASSIAALVAALNADGGDWRFVDPGSGPGDNPIRVGLIYRASRVETVGKPATLTGGPFDERSRAPLAQGFRAGQGPAFVVVANHLKSKGCSGAEGPDRDQHDGQACWNAVRVDSARRLAQWLQRDPTGIGSDLSVILGDFNAYAQEDPVRVFLDAGWRDALQGTENPYSFIYDGQAGRLDHALLSPALAGRLRGAVEWHANADEADNGGDHDGISGQVDGTPWRSSDHDPLLIGLQLRR